MQSTESTSVPERDLELERRRFVRRALAAAALVAPLFLALGWWTSRSFLLRETRFNELGLEVQVPRVVPRGLPLPVRFVTTDPLRSPHRAQVKWVARDAAGVELLRGAADSPGTLEVLIPADRADVASLEVRASDGAWARNATISIPRGAAPLRAELEALAFPSAGDGAMLLIAQRSGALSPGAELEGAPRGVWMAFDDVGVPLARVPARWVGPFALALWRPRNPGERARRFELRGPREEIGGRWELGPSEGGAGAPPATCRAELSEDGAVLRLSIELGEVSTAELRWWDAEREHARRLLRGRGPHELEIAWSAPRSGASFVSLASEKGGALALLELPAAAPPPLGMALHEAPAAAELELSAEPGSLGRGAHAVVFDAAATIVGTNARTSAAPRELAPEALGYFGGDPEALGRLGYGGLEVAHSSAALRGEQLARREAEELLARRIVFGTALALAGLCAAAWLLAIARSGSFHLPPAWRFASGAALLSLAFALIGALVWWRSPTLASPPPVPSPEPPAILSESLSALEPKELLRLGAPLALGAAKGDGGPLRFPASSFAGLARVAVRVIDAEGRLHRRELDLPQR